MEQLNLSKCTRLKTLHLTGHRDYTAISTDVYSWMPIVLCKIPSDTGHLQQIKISLVVWSSKEINVGLGVLDWTIVDGILARLASRSPNLTEILVEIHANMVGNIDDDTETANTNEKAWASEHVVLEAIKARMQQSGDLLRVHCIVHKEEPWFPFLTNLRSPYVSHSTIRTAIMVHISFQD